MLGSLIHFHHIFKRSIKGCTLYLCLIALASCGGDPKNPESPKQLNIVETAIADGRFTSLVTALEVTGLDSNLGDKDSVFTVFAPTDTAFTKLGDALTTLLDDKETLSDILLYHVIQGAEIDAQAAIAAAGTQLLMLNGDVVSIRLDGDALFINDSQVIITDVFASNGIIHVIDTVLTPPVVEDPKPELANIVDTAVAAGQFETLVAALQATELDGALADESSTFTVFAPTDQAFELLGEETINALLGDTDTLANILSYHVVPGTEIDSEAAIAAAGSMVEMLNGDAVDVSLRDDKLFINDSQVIIVDVKASNGIIHAIDMVLSPPAVDPQLQNIVDTAVSVGGFSSLVTALELTGLDAALKNEEASFTVFAPTDQAFANLGNVLDDLLKDLPSLSNILSYHVVAGAALSSEEAIAAAGTMLEMLNKDSVDVSLVDGRLFINGSEVVLTDVEASNGVIHVIDAVLTPPVPAPVLTNIVETAVDAGNFTTLVSALQVAGLDGALANEDEVFTVFAPTDDAFSLLGTDTINALLNDVDVLSNILTYHVIGGAAVDSAGAIAAVGTMVEMLNGDKIALTMTDGKLFVNDSEVIVTDIKATNGVIHVIDMVLTPPDETEPSSISNIVDTAIAADDFSTLVHLLELAHLDDALRDESTKFTVFAPTDRAFRSLGLLGLLVLADLPNVLSYHVIAGAEIDSAAALAAAGTAVEMLNGDSVDVSLRDGKLFINRSQVVVTDIKASNGIIHVIDTVLIP